MMKSPTVQLLAVSLLTCTGLFAQTVTGSRSSIDKKYGTYHALLIGISKYTNSDRHQNLPAAVNDVTALRSKLIEKYNFEPDNIQFLKNEEATYKQILRRIRSWQSDKPTRLGMGDNLLIYFAGHGQEAKYEGDQRNTFWVPADAKDQNEYMRLDAIFAEIKNIRARHTLLISDSCYAGAVLRGILDDDTSDGQAALSRSYQMLTSGTKSVPDGPKHSPFFGRLLSELTSRSKSFTVAKLATKIIIGLKGQQEVRLSKIPTCDDDNGQFFFYLKTDPREPKDIPGPDTGLPPGKILPDGFTSNPDATGMRRFTCKKDGAEMKLVKGGGRFRFGKGEANEKPGLDDMKGTFLIDMHEVTVGQYRKFLKETPRRSTPQYWNNEKYNHPDQPVVGVSLDEAKAYAAWAGKTIPSEIQWEYAAAFDLNLQDHTRTYPWEGKFSAGGVERVEDARPPKQSELPVKDVSYWGVVGMGSGVQEWCELNADDPDVIKDVGVRKGITQFPQQRDASLDVPISHRPDPDNAATTRLKNLGFRCIFELR